MSQSNPRTGGFGSRSGSKSSSVSYVHGEKGAMRKPLLLIASIIGVAVLICGISVLLWMVTKSDKKYDDIDGESDDLWKPGKGGFIGVWMGLYILQALAFVGLWKKRNKSGAKLSATLLLTQLVVGWAWMLFLKDRCDSSVPAIMTMSALSLGAAVVGVRACPGAALAITPTFVWLAYATAIASKACSHANEVTGPTPASASGIDVDTTKTTTTMDSDARKRQQKRKQGKGGGGHQSPHAESYLRDESIVFSTLPPLPECSIDAWSKTAF